MAPTCRTLLAAALVILSATGAALAQARPSPEALLAAQREAMLPLAWMDGVWRGPAEISLYGGAKLQLTQTERVGTLLDGTIRVMEGRGYAADSSLAFNAFGIASYDPATKAYTLHTYARGHAGDFPLRPTADGFVWEIAAGPATIRYTTTFKNGVWHEIGERIMPGQDPVRTIEMKLTRVGESDWPAAGAIPPR